MAGTKGGAWLSKVRVAHYVNQFFANIGSEDKADVPVGLLEGAVGPGKRLQNLLGDSAEIVVTVYCGDDYFAAHTKEALESILQIARDYNVKLLVAGPAFASGRFGFACAEVCHAVSSSLGLDCVSGMHPENPGVGIYKKYMDGKVFALPTREAVSGMEDALSRMAQSVSKLAAGLALGRPSIEGYIPRGFRRDEMVDKSGVERAVDMLLNKIAGRPFTTEIAVESLEKTPVAPRIVNLAGACLALATTSGVLPQGNPDGFKGYGNNQWRKYSIAKLDTMKNAGWDVMHSGYNSASMRDNPNYGVPLDICQELARDGAFARLFPYFYMTSGCNGAIPIMERIGREMVANMKAEGVDAALLVST